MEASASTPVMLRQLMMRKYKYPGRNVLIPSLTCLQISRHFLSGAVLWLEGRNDSFRGHQLYLQR